MNRVFGNWMSLRLLPLAISVGILSGSASALFLFGLDLVTDARIRSPWLLWLLPLGGAFISWLYTKYGGDSAKGNNLVIEQAYGAAHARARIPLRMAPLVLLGTWTTHLLGGSAGREGTAVQMGGSLSDAVSRTFKLQAQQRGVLLMCGISAGFGSVFGTPLAGAVFGIEVLAAGSRGRYAALLPCIVAAYTGHYVTTAWGIHHAHYSLGTIPPFSARLLITVAAAAVLFGLAALLFSTLTSKLKQWFASLIPALALRTFAGGFLVIGLVYLFGTREYLGLGLPLISGSFEEAASPVAFALKTLFTAITLGAGFQGGEVTPLFAIGATLGSALGGLLGSSVPLLAGIGLVSVFSGAANTPLACFFMGLELFGTDAALYLLIGCWISFICSGHARIYGSQQRGAIKSWMLRPFLNRSRTDGAVGGKRHAK